MTDRVSVNVQTANRARSVYIQALFEDDRSMFVEVPSNAFLRPPLSAEQSTRLVDMGWSAPEGDLPNFWKVLEVREQDPGTVAEWLERTLIDVYDATDLDEFSIDLDGSSFTPPYLGDAAPPIEESVPDDSVTVAGPTVDPYRVNQLSLRVNEQLIVAVALEELLVMVGLASPTPTACSAILTLISRHGLKLDPQLSIDVKSYRVFHDDSLIAEVFRAVHNGTEQGDGLLRSLILEPSDKWSHPLHLAADFSESERPRLKWAAESFDGDGVELELEKDAFGGPEWWLRVESRGVGVAFPTERHAFWNDIRHCRIIAEAIFEARGWGVDPAWSDVISNTAWSLLGLADIRFNSRHSEIVSISFKDLHDLKGTAIATFSRRGWARFRLNTSDIGDLLPSPHLSPSRNGQAVVLTAPADGLASTLAERATRPFSAAKV